MRAGVGSSLFVVFVLLTNRCCACLGTEADLAALGRVFGLQVRTAAITTLRAGARTSGQTSMLWSALGGSWVAHPIMLLNLLRTYRVTMPWRIPGDWCSHMRRRRVTGMRRTIRWAKMLLLWTRHRSTHSRGRGDPKGSGGGVTVTATWRIRVRREIAHTTGSHRIGTRFRLHLVPVDSTVSVGRVAHHRVVHKGVVQAWEILQDAFARPLSATAKVSTER